MKIKNALTNNKVISVIIVATIVFGFIWYSVHRIGLSLDFTTLWQYRFRFLQGFLMTVYISIGSLFLSLFIGLMTAVWQKSKFLPLQYLSKLYVQIIRGTPLLVQIYFFYYIIGTAWGLHNRYIAGIIILSLFEGAYISEIIRGGIESIAKQNFEIAKSIGLNAYQTFKFVTAPLVLARTIPALAGQFASIIKDSSLLSVIAVIELTQTTQEISSDNFRMFENYIFVGLLYLILTFGVSMISKKLEKRYNHELRT
ncbi:MAG: amino acid ABC transporter permease [Caldisericia bacterium]|nr:amino acid ABC transporter permease [Caldisericia bacterium]